MEFAPDSPLNSSKLDCTPVSPFSSHGSNGIFSPEKVAQFGTSRTTVCDPPGPIHPTALEPTVDPRARASKSDFHEFSHAYPPGRPPSTNSTIEILRLDHESSKQALNAKLAERHGEVENISDEFTLATPDRLEKIMSRLRLSQTTSRQETQLSFKPSIQQCATGTNRFLQGGAASTISSYGTLPPKHDLSAFKTPEREVHAYQTMHLRPGVVAVKETELIVQQNPPQIPAVVSTSPRRCIATTDTSAGSCLITAEKDPPNSTSPNAKVLALFFPKEGKHRHHHHDQGITTPVHVNTKSLSDIMSEGEDLCIVHNRFSDPAFTRESVSTSALDVLVERLLDWNPLDEGSECAPRYPAAAFPPAASPPAYFPPSTRRSLVRTRCWWL